MKQIVKFATRTSRSVFAYIGKLVKKLKHDGRITISITVSIPAIVRISFGYSVNLKSDNDNKKAKTAKTG